VKQDKLEAVLIQSLTDRDVTNQTNEEVKNCIMELHSADAEHPRSVYPNLALPAAAEK
jgi:hypothetical protein